MRSSPKADYVHFIIYAALITSSKSPRHCHHQEAPGCKHKLHQNPDRGIPIKTQSVPSPV